MKITITHATDTGRADDWVAESDSLPRKGIGKTWGYALEGLIRSNLEAFGVTELATVDPFHATESLRTTRWRSGGGE
jgi:hypothetical protein